MEKSVLLLLKDALLPSFTKECAPTTGNMRTRLQIRGAIGSISVEKLHQMKWNNRAHIWMEMKKLFANIKVNLKRLR